MVPYYDLGLEIQLIWSFGLAGATTVGFKQVTGFYIIGEPQGIHTFAQAQLPEQQCRDAAGFSNPGGLALMWWK